MKPDGRTSGARRLKELTRQFAEGFGELSAVDRALIRTAAVLSLQLERVEIDLSNGKSVDSDSLIRLASTSRRALAAVSAKATAAKPAGVQTIAEYWAAKQAAEPEDEDGEEG